MHQSKTKGDVLNSGHQLKPWRSSSSVSWPKAAWSRSQSAAAFCPSRTCEHSTAGLKTQNASTQLASLEVFFVFFLISDQTKQNKKDNSYWKCSVMCKLCQRVLLLRCCQKAVHWVRGALWLPARSGRAGHHSRGPVGQQRDECVAVVQVDTLIGDQSINQPIRLKILKSHLLLCHYSWTVYIRSLTVIMK